MPEITCYFSPQSGYAYLGHERLRAIARAHGAAIRWRPVDILRVFAAGGSTAPAKQSPQRNAYRKQDIVRWARLASIPINTEPRFWPTDTLPACRLIAAAIDLGEDPADLIGGCLEAVWARDLQIADLQVLFELAREAGLDALALSERAASPEAAALLESYTAEAVEQGVFGSPTYMIEDDLFFGQDRLHFVAEKLEQITEPAA